MVASANGTVSYTGISPTGGLTVTIKHNQRIRTTYLNFAGIYIKPEGIGISLKRNILDELRDFAESV